MFAQKFPKPCISLLWETSHDVRLEDLGFVATPEGFMFVCSICWGLTLTRVNAQVLPGPHSY